MCLCRQERARCICLCRQKNARCMCLCRQKAPFLGDVLFLGIHARLQESGGRLLGEYV